MLRCASSHAEKDQQPGADGASRSSVTVTPAPDALQECSWCYHTAMARPAAAVLPRRVSQKFIGRPGYLTDKLLASCVDVFKVNVLPRSNRDLVTLASPVSSRRVGSTRAAVLHAWGLRAICRLVALSSDMVLGLPGEVQRDPAAQTSANATELDINDPAQLLA